MKPKVSILMAVYNNEKTLEQALVSITNQNLQEWELVIVDDCSTDGTQNIIKGFAGVDNRIKVIRNSRNLGLASSLNIGVQNTTSDLIARMDGDDIMIQDRLKTQTEFMHRNPEIGVVGSGAILIDHNGRKINSILQPESHLRIRKTLPYRNPVMHPSVMVRKKLLVDYKYNRYLRKKQDYELWSRLIEATQFYNIQIPLIKYRVKTKERLSSVLLGTYVHMKIAVRLKSIFGFLFSIIMMFRSLLVKFGLYLPKSLKKE